jgi:hypothetical protein
VPVWFGGVCMCFWLAFACVAVWMTAVHGV